jgi:acyl carrier protein
MTPSNENVESRLRHILLGVLNNEVDVSALGPDVSLVNQGLSLDSVALLEFVVSIENEFSIILDDGVLTREHFESLGSLARAVQKEIARQHQTGV